MGKLLLLFILVPAIELILLIEIGGMIGTLATIATIVITGALGASLARWQGLSAIRRMQQEVAQGGIPTGALFDGVIILMAGALLMTPGFLTDVFGFSCLIPGFRRILKRFARKRVEKAIREGQGNVVVFGPGAPRRGPGPDGRDPRGNIEM